MQLFLIIFKKLLLTCFVPLFFLVSCSDSKTNEKIFVKEVHDGDTFKDNKNNVYRLFGVDTPELTDQYKNFEPTEGIQQIYARYATEKAKEMIESNNVEIEAKTVDRYKRHVVKVNINGEDLGLYLISLGLARVAYIDVVNDKNPFYSNDYSYYESLVWSQYKAFKKHLGIWRNYSEFKIIFPKA